MVNKHAKEEIPNTLNKQKTHKKHHWAGIKTNENEFISVCDTWTDKNEIFIFVCCFSTFLGSHRKFEQAVWTKVVEHKVL